MNNIITYYQYMELKINVYKNALTEVFNELFGISENDYTDDYIAWLNHINEYDLQKLKENNNDKVR